MPQGRSLLIVDDNAYMRTIVATIARACGVAIVEEAADGAEAFERMRHRKFDCAVVDLKMDPLNGIEFLRLLRSGKDSPDPHLGVIVLSAHSGHARILEARDAGADEILTKPVTAAALLERLHAVIHHRRPFVASETYTGPDRRRRRAIGYRGPFRRQDDLRVVIDE